MNHSPRVKHRGAVYPVKIIPFLKRRDYSFVQEQKMGYYLSYEEEHYQFHVVDRFASFPLYFTVQKGRLYVSERVDELIPHLPEVKFDPVGYYDISSFGGVTRVDRTPFCGIKRLMPGNFLIFENGKINCTRYWSFYDLKDKKFAGTYSEAAEELGWLMRQAVRRCYEFAPDAAVHLSGGIDSGTITTFLCKISGAQCQAYTYFYEGTSSSNEYSETGYIQKYKTYLPNLKVNLLKFNSSDTQEWPILSGANNWMAVLKDSYVVKELEMAKNLDQKYILTGLGGDELGSYITYLPRIPLIVHNDLQAKLYYNWVILRYTQWRANLTAFSRKTGLWRDVIRANSFRNCFLGKPYWFAPEFRKAASTSFKQPFLISDLTPSSFEYRLKILQESFFTIRSEKWNFVGSKYGVSYLHPFLDADLAAFSARLPINFIRRKPKRDLFKKALLKQGLPEDLVMGIKRPAGYEPYEIKTKDIQDLIQYYLPHIDGLRSTFAATVFDYKQIDKDLRRFLRILRTLPSSHQNTLGALNNYLGKVDTTIRCADYLNKYFS